MQFKANSKVKSTNDTAIRIIKKYLWLWDDYLKHRIMEEVSMVEMDFL